MLHLVLDTSIYRRTPRIDSSEFTVLSRLAQADQIRLHIPYVVEREFVTHLEHVQRSRIDKAIGALSRALDFPTHGPHTSKLASQLTALKSALPQLVSERSDAFLDWLDQTGAVRDHLTLDQTVKAMEAYFTGAPPLKQPKERKDIPDSFIFQQVLELQSDHPANVAAVVNDGALRSALLAAGVECWSSLRAFLTSPRGQSLVAQEIITKHKPDAYFHVLSIANDTTPEITAALEHALLSHDHSLIRGSHLPGETGEIYVSGVNEPHEVQIDDVEYLGDTIFVAQLSALVELTYDFPVSNFDAFELDTDKYSLGPLNDHYFEAETTDTFRFSASLELEFPMWDATPENTDQLKAALHQPTIAVTDLRDFEVDAEDVDTGFAEP